MKPQKVREVTYLSPITGTWKTVTTMASNCCPVCGQARSNCPKTPDCKAAKNGQVRSYTI